MASIIGRGRIFYHSHLLCEADYDLSTPNHSGSPHRSNGAGLMRAVSGDIFTSRTFLPIGETMTLELHDGRKIDFFSNGAGVSFMGSFY